MSSTILFVVSMLFSLVGLAASLGMMVLVLWQAPHQTINRLLAGYLACIAGWTLTTLLFRLTEIVDIIRFSAACFVWMSFLLLAVALQYTGYWRYRSVRALLAVGVVLFFVIIPVPIARTAIFVDANPYEFAGRIFHLNLIGYVIGVLIFLMSSAASVLFWRARHQNGNGLLVPALLAPISVISVVLPISLPIPMLIAAVTSILLSRVILRQNLFNPLLEVTRVLTASEAHYRHLAEELSRKELLYRTLARNLPNTTVALFDQDMRCLIFEGQGVTIRGKHINHAVEGHVLTDVLPVEIRPELTELYQAAFRGEEVNWQRTLDGRDVHIHVLPVSDERGNRFAGMIVLQDITDFKEAERRAMALMLEQERNLILRRFIADATHDLMTPMSGMQLSIDILQRELKDHPAAKRVEGLNSYTHRLTAMLQDMLEAARLDETVSLDRRPYDVNSLVRDVVKRSRDDAALRRQEIHVDYGSLPDVSADASMLDRVLMNLVRNAIAYTPEGGAITVSTSADSESVSVEVRDTGVGIHADDLDRIFERFYRVDKSRGLEDGGAGLGLSIARRIVELHGGHIDVESAPGKGSAFRVVLPVDHAVLETSA